MRQINERGIELIKKFEGLRLEAYRCPAGKLTIGFGHVQGVTEGLKITAAQADVLLAQDLQQFCLDVAELVKVYVSDDEFAALVAFTFNVGTEALRRSTLLRLLNRGEHRRAAEEFPKWCKARQPVTGRLVELKGLKRRRLAEQALFLRKA